MYLLFVRCPSGKTFSKNTYVKKEDMSNALNLYKCVYHYKLSLTETLNVLHSCVQKHWQNKVMLPQSHQTQEFYSIQDPYHASKENQRILSFCKKLWCIIKLSYYSKDLVKTSIISL